MTSFRQHILDNCSEYGNMDIDGLTTFTEEGIVDFVFAMIEEYDLRRSEDDDRGTDS